FSRDWSSDVCSSDLGADVNEHTDQIIDRRNHQVHVNGGRHAMLAQSFTDHGTNGEIGHVMIVHHVEVHDIGAGGQHVIDFLTQAGEIGGEDRWGNQIGVHRCALGQMNYRQQLKPASLSACHRFSQGGV